MCPIQLTTGIQPRTAASMLTHDHKILEVLDEQDTRSVNDAARDLAKLMETIYDMANVARRAKSETNRKNTSHKAIPNIDIGDFVLFAKHKEQKKSKLDYTWLGPAVVVAKVTPFVYRIRP